MYGIANKTGKPNRAEALEILRHGFNHGIDSIDTAPGYGESENLIGEFIEEQKKKGLKLPSIITKISALKLKYGPTFEYVYDYMKESIKKSIHTMRVNHIDVCLLHSSNDMASYEGKAVSCLLKLKEQGYVKETGVSVYKPEEALKAISLDCFDAIQVPINLLDHRLINSGIINELYRNNIKVYARSVFLQGLIFLEPDNLPLYLQDAKEIFKMLKELSNYTGLNPQELAMLFVRDVAGVEKIVVGCETLDQLKDNLKIINLPELNTHTVEQIRFLFKDIPEKIINPKKWNQTEYYVL